MPLIKQKQLRCKKHSELVQSLWDQLVAKRLELRGEQDVNFTDIMQGLLRSDTTRSEASPKNFAETPKVEFRRTASRVIEMQSKEYLARAHRAA